MRLVTLNIWGGRIRQPLFDFLSKRTDIDIFCFQEVFHNLSEEVPTSDYIFEEDAFKKLFDELQSVLPDYTGYFCPTQDNSYGLATFVRNNIKVKETGNILLYENTKYDPKSDTSDHNRKLQWLKISNGSDFIIMNVHGHWTGQGKGDNPARLHQSKEIVTLLEKFKDFPRILCGDFNLRPDTESIRLLESGMVNLITKYNISSTRTGLYTKPEKFADYIFNSPDIEIKTFEVLPDEVSDHAALFIEI